MHKLFLSIFLTTIIWADSSSSQFLLQSESKRVDHELKYGLSNNYTMFSATHKIVASDSVSLFYGTKMGVISESCSSQEGHGLLSEAFGIVLEAAAGLEYQLIDRQHIALKGRYLEDDLHHKSQNNVTLSYSYKF